MGTPLAMRRWILVYFLRRLLHSLPARGIMSEVFLRNTRIQEIIEIRSDRGA
jgi:hypothetical protein